MAGEWLKFEASTPEKREVFSMTSALGWSDPDLTVGKLLKVWRWFDQHTVCGNADGVTLALLDHIIGVTGFAQAMCDVGWLVVTDAGISLPNFDRHNGKTAKERALTAKRVAKHKTNAGANAGGNGKANATTVSGALPREEKNREEVSNTPIPPKGRKLAISFPKFISDCKANNETPIPDDHPVFAYADEAKIPRDFLALHWFEFKDRYGDGSKKYKDWRKVFSNSVRGNWFRLWYAPRDGGEYQLTTDGVQAQNVHGEKLK
jgi:hypothetical protein